MTLIRRKIIVADDEMIIADTLATILNQNGFEATPAYGGNEAIAKATSIRADLLLSDVLMPDLDGVRVAIAVCKRLPSCKVLLFSGQASTVDLLQTARDEGYQFEVLAKPIWPRDLLAKVVQYLDGNSEK